MPERASFWLGIFQELALGWFQHIKTELDVKKNKPIRKVLPESDEAANYIEKYPNPLELGETLLVPTYVHDHGEIRNHPDHIDHIHSRNPCNRW